MNSWVSLTLFGLSFGLGQTVLSQQGYYVVDERTILFLPIAVYGSVSLGCLMGLLRGFRRWSIPQFFLLQSIFYFVCIEGLSFFSEHTVIWICLGFLGSGVFLVNIFSRFDLRQIVLALGGGLFLSYVFLYPLYTLLNEGIVLLAVGLPLVGAVIKVKEKTHFVIAFLSALLMTGLFYLGWLIPAQGQIIAKTPGLKGAHKVIPTIFHPLILTDLLWAPRQKALAIITNGRRFSQVVNDRDLVLAKDSRKLHASFDTPYLLASPKKVLVIGPAGGMNVLTAFRHGADEVWGVDINPSVFSIMKSVGAESSGHLYFNSKFISVVGEGRSFIESTSEKFDLIVMQGVQTGSRSNLLSPVLLESFLMTEESISKMWKILNPGGMIFFEEYLTYPRSPKNSISLLGTVAQGALRVLDINQDKQTVYFEFLNDSENIGVTDAESRQFREGLVLSKKDISGMVSGMKEQLVEGQNDANQDLHLKIKDIPISINHFHQRLRDDNPYFFYDFLLAKKRSILGFGLFLFLLVILGNFIRRASIKDRLRDQRFIFMGLGYTSFVFSLLGPWTLLLGSPQVTTPLVFGVLLLSSMIGGLYALRPSSKMLVIYVIILLAILVLLPHFLPFLKAVLLKQTLLVRLLILSFILGGTGFLMEIPYIKGLNEISGSLRTQSFIFGKISAVLGIYLGILVVLYYGFSGGLYLASVFYLFMSLNWWIEILLREKALSARV